MSAIRELADALHALILVVEGGGVPARPADVRAAEERARAAFDALLQPEEEP